MKPTSPTGPPLVSGRNPPSSDPFFASWPTEPSLEQILDYIGPDPGRVSPRSGLYVYSNSVCTVDGVTHFSGSQPSDIALGKTYPTASAVDFKCLNAGWATTDAILFSRKSLESEPHVLYYPQLEECLQYRIRQGKEAFPLQVLVSGSGDVPFEHGVFEDARYRRDLGERVRVVIYTTSRGAERVEGKLRAQERFQNVNPNTWTSPRINLVVRTIPSPTHPHQVSLPAMTHDLKTHFQITRLELSAGPETIHQFIAHRLLDEQRMTISGQLLGPTPVDGLLFPPTRDEHYGVPPKMRLLGLRCFERRLLFQRWEIVYPE